MRSSRRHSLPHAHDRSLQADVPGGDAAQLRPRHGSGGLSMNTAGELQEKLLDAALPHVPFDGWGETALLAGARDLGIERGLALNAFPGGAVEMIEYHSRLADRRMVEAYEAADTAALKIREKVVLAILLPPSA